MDAAGERRGGREPRGRVRAARERRVGRSSARFPDDTFVAARAGLGARRPRATRARSTPSRPGAGVEHRVVPWDEVSLEEGTGIVHIATGCGGEDFELGRVARPAGADAGRRGRPLLRRLRLAARALDGRGGRPDRRRPRRARLPRRGRARTVHNYPHCWRCDTPLIFRISDDWFIARRRRARRSCSRRTPTVEWVPEYMGKRMDDWLRNMGDWNISRRRYYGLPLPFYPCACGQLNVIGSKAELARARARGLRPARRSCAGPGSTACRSAARRAASRVERVLEVGDVWLDAGHRPVLDARLAEPGVESSAATRPARRPGCRAPTSPITPTGRSGSRPTG